MKKLNQTLRLFAATFLLAVMANNSNAQMIATGSNSNSSFFMCSTPGHPQASGNNVNGQIGDGSTINIDWPLPIGGIQSMKAVASGPTHTLYLQNNGAVYACGSNSFGQLGIGNNFDSPNLVQVVGPSSVIGIAAGVNFSLFLLSDSSVWACGYNANGQLGDGTTINRVYPVKVRGLNNVGFLTGVTAISAGSHHSLFIKRENNGDSRAWACGSNSNGQLGLQDTTLFNSLTPNLASRGTGGSVNIKAISAGINFSLFLSNDTAWACGNNGYAQLGDLTTTNRFTGIMVHGVNNIGVLTGIKAISAGGSHSLFLKNSYLFYSCGRNNVGQLGNGYTGYDFDRVFPLFKFNREATITGGTVLNGSGKLNVSGFYSQFLWSNGSTLDYTTVNTTGTYSVTVSDAYGCTATTSQKVIVNSQSVASGSSSNSSFFMCSSPGIPNVSGNNLFGQLGNGNTTNINKVAALSGLTNIKMISGSNHTLFLKNDNTVLASGSNSSGQLGDLTYADKSTPVQVSGLTDVTAVAAGGNHSLFLKSNGTVRACGLNTSGQLGDSTTTSRNITMLVQGLAGITAIAAGTDFSLFLDNRGVVYACGKNDQGQLGQYNTLTNELTPVWVYQVAGEVIAIAAGDKHSLFLKKDGTVWSCGNNQFGQLGDNTLISSNMPKLIPGLSDVIAIAAGGNHSLFMKKDSTVWACGLNSNGQLGDNSIINKKVPVKASALAGSTAIAGGNSHSLFLKSDGTIWSCGKNNSGQLADTTNIDKKKSVLVQILPASIPTINATANPVCKGSSTTLSIASGNLNSASSWKWYTSSCGGTLVGTGNSITVVVNNNTKYYVRGEGGCQAPGSCAIFDVNTNSLPSLTVTPAVDTLCPPTTSKLITVVGATNYSWFPATGLNQTTGSAVLAAPTATSTYTVIGTDGNGCSSSKTARIVINPAPNNLTNTNITATSAIANWSHISCATGYTLQYRVKGAPTWTTLQINTNTNSVLAAGLTPNTTYQWKVRTKFSSGTSAYSSSKNFKTLALRIGDVAIAEILSLFPNPTTGMVTISMNDCMDCNFQLNVYDILGNLVYTDQNKADGQTKTIDLSELAKGIYQVQLEYNGVTKNSKLIKQ